METLNVTHTDKRFLSRELASEEHLKTLGLEAGLAKYVRVMDTDGALTLLHYLTPVLGENGPIDTKVIDKIGGARGVILDSEKVVCRSLPYTPEIDSSDKPQLEKYFSGVLDTWKFYHACEGTVIRVYWSGSQWEKSTHRKIDSYNSFWSGPSFGELFDKVAKFAPEDLNKDWCYAFLLSHAANRLVYKIPEEGQLMLISVYDQKNKIFIKPEFWGEPLEGVVVQPPIEGITTLEGLIDLCERTAKEDRFDRAGVIAFSDEEHPAPVKVLATAYNKLRNVRGNDPNIGNRYVQLMGTEDGELLKSWYSDAENTTAFERAKGELEDLVDYLHGLYISRFVHKVIETLPKEEFVVIRRCHSWHTENRRVNIVTPAKVREVLNGTAGQYILAMLKRRRQEKSE